MKLRLISLNPTLMDDWIVQASILNNQSICIVMRHSESGDTLVRFFVDEHDAHDFVTDVLCGDYDNTKQG